MAKRFIDTGLFDDEWFSELSIDGKLFWIYYLTKCDHAGLLKYNKKLIEFQTGINSLDTVIELFGKRLVRVKEELLFCPKFIVFQYPGFPKSGVKQQDGAIKLLVAAGLWDSISGNFNSSVTVKEDLPKSYGYVYGIDNGNVIEYGSKSDFQISVKKVYAGDKPKVIYDLEKYFTAEQLEQFKRSGWTRFEKFMKDNPGRVFDDDDHVYNSFRNYHLNGSGKAKTTKLQQ